MSRQNPSRRCNHRSEHAIQSLERRLMLAADVVISEILSANSQGITDQFDNHPDWIELYNRGDAAQDLSGWKLADDDGNVWEFGTGVSLSAGSHLLIFASDRDIATGDELHASFKID